MIPRVSGRPSVDSVARRAVPGALMDDIGLITADNPGPFTLRGTNTWLVGRNPCFVVDPGPLAEPIWRGCSATRATAAGSAASP